MKHILLVFTNYRVCERIIPIINPLTHGYKLSLFCIGQMSKHTQWYGDNDPRGLFLARHKKCFENVFHSASINQPGAAFNTKIQEFISKELDLSEYDGIILDDCKSKYGLQYIYSAANKLNIPVIGNNHGNSDKLDEFISNKGKVFDYLFVFGKKEVKADFMFATGIPSNDALINFWPKQLYVLVIANFLGNRPSAPFPIKLDHKFMEEVGLYDINVPIIIKLKSRLDEKQDKQKLAYAHSLLNGKEGEVLLDVDDDNELIANAYFVISAPSTLAYKAIQYGKPTVLIKGSGATGSFSDYEGLVDLDLNEIVPIINKQLASKKGEEEFIRNSIEGGLEFKSTEIYVKKVNELFG